VGLGDHDGGGDDQNAEGVSDILWHRVSGSIYRWRMMDPIAVTTMCGNLGCANGYLPTISAAGLGVVNK
jgi:hypothetical protein